MSNKSMKFERIFSVKEAAVFLRNLAENIENIHVEQLKELDFELDDFQKLKIGLKRQDEIITLKVKVKGSPSQAPEEAAENIAGHDYREGMKKYSSLKKKMDKNFKAMGKMLDAGTLPDQAMVAAFFEDSQQMVAYPGYGDEFYESYIAACEEFQKRVAGGVVDDIREQYGIVRAMKKECHSRYK